MDLEVSKALLAEQHLREINEFEEGWKIDEHDLTWVRRLAAGGFGEVWEGKWEWDEMTGEFKVTRVDGTVEFVNMKTEDYFDSVSDKN